MRLMLFTSSAPSTFIIACSGGPQGSWATSLLLPGPPGQGGDRRWQERSWQQERRTSPEEHRDSISPAPCEAETNFDTWGPDRLVIATAIFSPTVHQDAYYSENTALAQYTRTQCVHTCIVPYVQRHAACMYYLQLIRVCQNWKLWWEFSVHTNTNKINILVAKRNIAIN